MTIDTKSFRALALDELYAILRLRQEVFIVEQNCFYLDADGKDQDALHLLAWGEDKALLATLRVLPPGLAYVTAGIGRMAVAKQARGTGLGTALMREGLRLIAENYGGSTTITAQIQAMPFYEKLGFAATGTPFDEAGIPHMKMVANTS